MNKKDVYCRIPNGLLRYENENIDANEKQIRLFLYSYLAFYRSYSGKVNMNLESLLRLMGIQREAKHMKKTNKYKIILRILDEVRDRESIIFPKTPNKELRITEMFTLKYDFDDLITIDKHFNGEYTLDANYTIMTLEEYETLVENNNTRTRLNDLYVYMYIKSCMNRRKEYEDPKKYPESCYISQYKLQEASGLARETIRKTIAHLAGELNLLAYKKPKNQYQKRSVDNIPGMRKILDAYHNMSTIYVLKMPGYEKELEYGMDKYIAEVNALFNF